MPAFVALHETVAVPLPVMLLGDIAPQVSPDCGLSVSETVPVKWFWDVMVIVDVAEDPALTAAGDVAVIVKFTTWTRTATWWDRLLLVLVTVAV